MEKIRCLLDPMRNEEAPQFSLVPFRLTQQPRSRKTMSFTVAAVLRCAAASRREVEDKKEKRGKIKEGRLTLFIRRRVAGGREKRGGQRMIIQPLGRLDFRNGY